MTDNAIIELFFERNDRAVTALEEKYGRELKNYAERYLRDRRDAEEVYVDTLTDVWNAIPPTKPQKLIAFLMTIIKRRTVNRLRYLSQSKRAQAMTEIYEEFDEVTGRLSSAENVEDAVVNDRAGAVNSFLRSESEVSCAIFVKRYYYGLSVKEIAEETGLSKNAVTTRLSRTRDRLYDYLKKEGGLL